MAYLSVILIWSTTPLAIKWSGEGVGFLLGISLRMIIALAICLIIVVLLKKKLRWDRSSCSVYLAVGIPLYAAMMCVYWGAQYISSGLISVVFGLTPLMTGLLAYAFLNEKAFSVNKLLGLVLGLTGLGFIFKQSLVLEDQAFLGIMGVLGAVFFHSIGTVWVKKVGFQMPVFLATTGGIIVAVFCYLVTWFLFDRSIPNIMPDHALLSILYLAVIGSVLGAMLFYYALKHLDTGKMALLTLITPVTALLIGYLFNNETVALNTIIGTACVMSGFICYQWLGACSRTTS